MTCFRLRLGSVVCLATLLLVSLPAQAQTTGGITFVVSDTDGNPLPEVAITLESEKLTGFRLRETDELGRARFPLLPPGAYLAEFVVESYATIRIPVDVKTGTTKVERVTMTAGELTDEISVSSEAPLDVTNTVMQFDYGEETMKEVQIGSANRSYQDVLQNAPGVGGGGNPAVNGATLGENRYLIDGVDTTDPVTGTFGLNLNFETIDTIELKTGAFRAEYGLVVGGLVNVVTKSGSNKFNGSVDLRFRDQDMGDDGLNYSKDIPRSFKSAEIALGGPVVKDKLWYQFGYKKPVNDETPTGGFASRQFDADYLHGKLRWQPHMHHRVDVQFTSDPTEINNVNAGPSVLVDQSGDAHYYQKQGGSFLSGTYLGSFADAWTLEGQIGFYDTELNAFPQNDNGQNPLINLANGFLSRNYDDAQFSNRERQQWNWKLGYTSSGRRFHEIKGGMEVQNTSFDFRREQVGTKTEYVLQTDTDADPFGQDPTLPIVRTDELISAGITDAKSTVTSFFLQDTWHATDKLTVDVGLRWDHVSMENDAKNEVANFAKWQPRLGVAYDIHGDGRHLLTGSASRNMHPGILVIPYLLAERGDTTIIGLDEGVYGIDCDGDGETTSGFVEGCFISGGPGGTLVDDSKATYSDEFTVGYRHAPRDNVEFGVRYIFSETKDIIEDTWDDVQGAYVFTNIDELGRKYQGLQLDGSWHGKRVHLLGNWTLSWTKGNVEYTQHAGVDWDFIPQHSVNRYGWLRTDARHRIKMQGWVDLPRKFSIGWNTGWQSGLAYNKVENTGPYGTEFLEPRGSYRDDDQFNLDTDFKKHFDIGPTRLTLIGSVLNLTNDRNPTSRNQLVDSHSEPLTYPTPRRWELGLRFEW